MCQGGLLYVHGRNIVLAFLWVDFIVVELPQFNLRLF